MKGRANLKKWGYEVEPTTAKLPKIQKITPLMHPLIFLWLQSGMLLFWANKGEPLMCEICSGAERKCTNEAQTCLPVLDKCATLRSESIVTETKTQPESLKVMLTTIKVCIDSKDCNEDLTIVNMGKGGIISTKLSCCPGIQCNKKVFPLPPINRTLNGKECKGCFGLHKTSCNEEEVVHCAGEQMYCVDLSGIASFRNSGTVQAAGHRIPSTEIALKGCASKAFCDAFHKGMVHVSKLVVVAEGHCWLASDKGGTTPLQLGGAFLSGLLLIKILI
ncbi:phospholipase A2 inhibitor and Ly6/PLAUR domain-containing protein-like [Anolis sagrei]|uniref:phospholipase A2 inhibitor and Ly6/PLAUR domain-containing protein-like n=1 Tax=Anolis sagrei TaxID=38937 RepID=UPI00352111D4